MKSDSKLKEIDIKNRTCNYFDGTIKIEGFDLDDILIDKKSYKNILVYKISKKNLIFCKYLRIRFDKTDGLFRFYDGIRYLVLSGKEEHDFVYNRIRCLAGVKRGITYVNTHNYAKIKIKLYESLTLVKTMIFHNIIILIKSVWNKDQNHYCHNIFLKKASNELPKKQVLHIFELNIRYFRYF